MQLNLIFAITMEHIVGKLEYNKTIYCMIDSMTSHNLFSVQSVLLFNKN